MIVISNSSPLIALAKVGLLGLLKALFGEVIIPRAVWAEVVEHGGGRPGSEEVARADWIRMRSVSNRLAVDILRRELGPGEAEAIVLAKELGADLVLVDDERAREIARSLGLRIAGTIALLLMAWEKDLLVKNPVDIAEEMRAKGVWISDELMRRLRASVETHR